MVNKIKKIVELILPKDVILTEHQHLILNDIIQEIAKEKNLDLVLEIRYE